MSQVEIFVSIFVAAAFVQHVVVRHFWPRLYERWLELDREMRRPMLFVIRKCITPRTIRAAIRFLKW
jgi:hypothetical protein